MNKVAMDTLQKTLNEMSQLVETYPLYIPVLAAAQILHIKPEALRASIEQGRCPFGFCWQLGDRMAYKLPTLAFVAWITQGAILTT